MSIPQAQTSQVRITTYVNDSNNDSDNVSFEFVEETIEITLFLS